MKLSEKMAKYSRNFMKQVPPEVIAVMQEAKAELRRSGILARVIKVGDRAPDFALTNTDGRRMTLGDLLHGGWLVLGFYRGRW
jgi:hypothetical protein